MVAKSAKKINRIFGLDLMRAIAMFSVIVAHSGFDRLFGLRHGIIAVESFFVMSGFLIGEMLIRDFRNGFGMNDLKNFWIKRWFRTLPLYYAVLLLKFIFIDHSISFNLGYYFLFLQNNFYGINFLPVSWTLVLEEWFYLVIPVLIFLLFRKGINASRFYWFVLLFVIASNVVRFAWVYYTDRPYGAITGNFPLRFDSFLIGVGLAAVKLFSGKIFEFMSRTAFFLASLFGLVVLLYFFAISDGGNQGETDLLWVRTVWYTLISVSIALLLPFIDQGKPVLALGKINPLNFIITWISFLSYPIYLIHLDFFRLTDQYFPFIAGWNPIAVIFFRLLFIVPFSLLLYKLIHEPLIALRTKVLSKRPREPEPVAPGDMP